MHMLLRRKCSLELVSAMHPRIAPDNKGRPHDSRDHEEAGHSHEHIFDGPMSTPPAIND